MLLLGIDTSGKTASAALYDTESGVILAQNTLYTQKTHSQVIMPMCRDIIAQTGKTMSDIGGIAVANGPGSYTGLRIGTAAVKAMSYALGCGCAGVSTLEGLAMNNSAFRGVICSVMKARGEFVYCGVYRSCGEILERLSEERIIDRSELAAYLSSLDEDVMLCGDGAEEFAKDHADPKFILASPMGRLQNAAGICLAAASREMTDPELLEVSYLQKVKAEKDLEEKNAL